VKIIQKFEIRLKVTKELTLMPYAFAQKTAMIPLLSNREREFYTISHSNRSSFIVERKLYTYEGI